MAWLWLLVVFKFLVKESNACPSLWEPGRLFASTYPLKVMIERPRCGWLRWHKIGATNHHGCDVGSNGHTTGRESRCTMVTNGKTHRVSARPHIWVGVGCVGESKRGGEWGKEERRSKKTETNEHADAGHSPDFDMSYAVSLLGTTSAHTHSHIQHCKKCSSSLIHLPWILQDTYPHPDQTEPP